ncbi:hypothetical protein FB567DRAFT_191176 [Paraphoma chrysanthemicola]|uniref:Uncharacterized protein n=1 Tax=Paraphoma chrysanthemicola TaxID=798071 RepID=A0A8K0VTI6_9PLEO|nr:hypothetical protein FB567DRAFT_191176 [Paraphoma chrysanthemicola]
MARLNVPTTLKHIAACVSKNTNPAASPRRAPSQSATSISRSTVTARSTSVLPAASRAASAVSKALQHERSARVPAASSKTTSGADFWAPRDFKILDEKNAYDKHEQDPVKSRIPRPLPLPENVAKWTHARWHGVPVKNDQSAANDEVEEGGTIIITQGAGHVAVSVVKEMVAKRDYDYEIGPQQEAPPFANTADPSNMGNTIEDDDSVFDVDGNPDLLHDESFDDTVDAYQQSSPAELMQRMGTKMATFLQGGRIAKCPRTLRRPVKLETAKVRAPSRIPRPQVMEMKTKAKKVDPGSKIYLTTSKRQHRPQRRIYSMTFKPELNRIVQAKIDAQVAALRQMRSEDIIADENAALEAPHVDDSHSRPDSAVDVKTDPKLEELAALIAVPRPVKKALRFSENNVKSVLFDRDAPATDLNKPLSAEDGWTPLKMATSYAGGSQSVGFESMFETTKEKNIRLKRRVLHRFKAVQEFEQRRKVEAMAYLANDECAPLGQLEYGNADFKISLQVKKVITAHDIGMFKDASEIGRGIPMSVYNPFNRPLLHFGGFQDELKHPFEDVYVPAKTTVAYKEPIRWLRARTAEQLENWMNLNISVMQRADVET